MKDIAQVAKAVGSVAFHEVDAHNVVPVWVVSNKREYGARTIRTKVHKHLPEFLKVCALCAAPSAIVICFRSRPCKRCQGYLPHPLPPEPQYDASYIGRNRSEALL